MKPTALLERIGQAIASVGKKPDEQLSMADLKVIDLVIRGTIWDARREVCTHPKTQVTKSGFCVGCSQPVEQKEAVK